MPGAVYAADTSDGVSPGVLCVGLAQSIEFGTAGVDLVARVITVNEKYKKLRTSEVSFFDEQSWRCACNFSFGTIKASPFERGGSLNPRSFCLSLKFASIERYNVFNQLDR